MRYVEGRVCVFHSPILAIAATTPVWRAGQKARNEKFASQCNESMDDHYYQSFLDWGPFFTQKTLCSFTVSTAVLNIPKWKHTTNMAILFMSLSCQRKNDCDVSFLLHGDLLEQYHWTIHTHLLKLIGWHVCVITKNWPQQRDDTASLLLLPPKRHMQWYSLEGEISVMMELEGLSHLIFCLMLAIWNGQRILIMSRYLLGMAHDLKGPDIGIGPDWTTIPWSCHQDHVGPAGLGHVLKVGKEVGHKSSMLAGRPRGIQTMDLRVSVDPWAPWSADRPPWKR